jgi:glucuronate isomerase
LPIIDYHCHINPEDIAKDRRFHNITQLWLGKDHYKWRLMRAFGIEERYITGDASDYDKFIKWAGALGKAIGNPLYHWSHLELQRYFGYYGVLNRQTADEVWELCNHKLQDPAMSAVNLIKQSNVKLICTTDDPIDTLEWHREIASNPMIDAKVLPAWRPDQAMNIHKAGFAAYLQQLESVSHVGEITSFEKLKAALRERMAYFADHGCRLADHGPEYCMYQPASDEQIEDIFHKKRNGMELSEKEIIQYKTAFLLFMGREYHQMDWTMQIHYGCKRDNNQRMFDRIGPDTGYDCIGGYTCGVELVDFLDALSSTDELPRTIVYSLNPHDNEMIDTMIACFQDASAVSKIQHGSAWWFNDHKVGIEQQITSLANAGNLSGFVGMLTDSRSFLSYTRHEYFRRILCNLIGNWVENGEFAADEESLREIVMDICYYNAERYFRF